jgi:RimJ/RimL family protein N-acetyltransferase
MVISSIIVSISLPNLHESGRRIMLKPVVIAETERLILRHFDLNDSEALDRVYGDPEVMLYSRGVRTPEWVRERLRQCLEDYRVHGFGLWAVVAKTTLEVLGYCGLGHFPDASTRSDIEIGYRLMRPHWGHGYATEAARAVRDYGFDTLNLPRLIAVIDPRNIASIRVAEKIGLCYERDVEGFSGRPNVFNGATCGRTTRLNSRNLAVLLSNAS